MEPNEEELLVSWKNIYTNASLIFNFFYLSKLIQHTTTTSLSIQPNPTSILHNMSVQLRMCILWFLFDSFIFSIYLFYLTLNIYH